MLSSTTICAFLLNLHGLAAALPATTTAASAPEVTVPVYPGVPTQTRLSTSTRSSSTVVFQPNMLSRSFDFTEHITRTAYQPGPFPAAALPATVTQRVITRMVRETRGVEFAQTHTLFSTWTGTGPESYVVFPAAAARATAVAAVGPPPLKVADAVCGSGTVPVCLERQCDVGADGQYWCLLRTKNEADMDWRAAMGRACLRQGGWRPDFNQTFTPCLEGDVKIACTTTQDWVCSDLGRVAAVDIQ